MMWEMVLENKVGRDKDDVMEEQEVVVVEVAVVVVLNMMMIMMMHVLLHLQEQSALCTAMTVSYAEQLQESQRGTLQFMGDDNLHFRRDDSCVCADGK
jgi:hypothetical protein